MSQSTTIGLPQPSPDTPADVRLAASYARKSNKDSEGIEAQHAINRRAAARDGYWIPDQLCFDDDDTSGVTTSRKGFDRLVKLIESRQAPFKVLYVRNRKRLGRWDDAGMHDFWRIYFKRHEVELRYSEGPNPDYSRGMTPEVIAQSLYDRIEAIDASTERTEIKRRINTGIRHRIVEGFWPGTTAPYATERWLADLRTGALVQRVEEGATIRRRECGYKLVWRRDGSYRAVQLIFEWVETERLGSTEIVRRLEELGLPPPVHPRLRSLRGERKGLRWTTCAVDHILRNRIYCGQLLWPANAPVEKAVLPDAADLNDDAPILHPDFMPDPPVSVDRFEAVQEILRTGRRRTSPKTPAVRPLLSGIVRCSHCDAPWFGHRGIYYRHGPSRGRHERECCPHLNRYVRIEAVDSAVLDQVLPYLETESFIEDLERQLGALLGHLDSAEAIRELGDLRNSLEEIDCRILRLIRDKASTDDEMLLQHYNQVLKEFEAEAKRLRNQIQALESRRVSIAAARQRHTELITAARNVVAVFRQLPMHQRKSVLSELVAAVRYDPVQRHAAVQLRLRP